jgi:hypothetical protein
MRLFGIGLTDKVPDRAWRGEVPVRERLQDGRKRTGFLLPDSPERFDRLTVVYLSKNKSKIK